VADSKRISDVFIGFAVISGLLTVALYSLEIGQIYQSRGQLSERARDAALEACERESEAAACRERVERFHEDCFQWTLTDHGSEAGYDESKYRRCLRHPPGEFR
jgi:hypothetical protein